VTQPVSRRNALGLFSTIGLGALLAACTGSDPATSSAPTTVPTEEGGSATVTPRASGSLTPGSFAGAGTCTLSREMTEGPYYFDVDAIRADVREGKPGTSLRLGVLVQDADSCEPLPDAVVDIWHCDAEGLYSGFESASRGGPGGGRTDDETYLRGAQVTNADGIVEFTTIYPGWYRGRTVHIHCTVHLNRNELLTSQLFFDDEVTDRVYAGSPYADSGERDVRNTDDGIFDESLVLTTTQDGDGYLALITFSVPA
jgi:protocatechuate 3,4-dioxygenase beta subunit